MSRLVEWPGPRREAAVALGFDPLPYASGSVTEVVAHDTLAGLPASVWRRVVYEDAAGRERTEVTVWRPRVHLLGEVWRFLAVDGVLVAETPARPPTWGADPRHEAPAWTEAAWTIYSGEDDPRARALGLPGVFVLLEQLWVGRGRSVLRTVARKGRAL